MAVTQAANGMISFIVPAHNEELLIGQALAALAAAAQAVNERHEIIVVRDGLELWYNWRREDSESRPFLPTPARVAYLIQQTP